jgi:hypothetical protein
MRCALFSLNPIEVETLTCEWCWTVPALQILACMWTQASQLHVFRIFQTVLSCVTIFTCSFCEDNYPYMIYIFIYQSRWYCFLRCVWNSTIVTMNSCVPFPSGAWIHVCTYVFMISCVEICLSTGRFPDKGVIPNFCKQESETQKKGGLGRSWSVGPHKKQNNSFILPTGAALEQMLP